jgi:hypothetical protein
MTEVHRIIYRLRRPTSATDPGAYVEGYYTVVRGTVMLTDDAGNPLKRERKRMLLLRGDPEEPTRWQRALGKDEDAHKVARQLLMQKHAADQAGRPAGPTATLLVMGGQFSKPARNAPVIERHSTNPKR